MRQLAAQDALDRATLLAELLNAYSSRHGRPATPVEAVPLENIATGTIRIRRLESQGRASLEERRLLAQWWRASGFLKGAQPEPKPPGHDLQEYLREKYGTAPTEEAKA
jgi:hypothetical protein